MRWERATEDRSGQLGGLMGAYLRQHQAGTLLCACGQKAKHVTSNGGICKGCAIDRRWARTLEAFRELRKR